MVALEAVVTIFIFVVTAALVFYRNFTRGYRKWTSIPGVPSLKPSFPFGNMGDLYMQKKSYMDATLDVMDRLKGHRYVAFHKTSDKRLKESAINRENIQDVVMAESHICLWVMTKY